jgi:hypothetical protein
LSHSARHGQSLEGLCSTVAAPFHIPICNIQGSDFSRSLSTLSLPFF